MARHVMVFIPDTSNSMRGSSPSRSDMMGALKSQNLSIYKNRGKALEKATKTRQTQAGTWVIFKVKSRYNFHSKWINPSKADSRHEGWKDNDSMPLYSDDLWNIKFGRPHNLNNMRYSTKVAIAIMMAVMLAAAAAATLFLAPQAPFIAPEIKLGVLAMALGAKLAIIVGAAILVPMIFSAFEVFNPSNLGNSFILNNQDIQERKENLQENKAEEKPEKSTKDRVLSFFGYNSKPKPKPKGKVSSKEAHNTSSVDETNDMNGIRVGHR